MKTVTLIFKWILIVSVSIIGILLIIFILNHLGITDTRPLYPIVFLLDIIMIISFPMYIYCDGKAMEQETGEQIRKSKEEIEKSDCF